LPLERLEEQICELAGHLTAATCQFPRRGRWPGSPPRTPSAAWPRWPGRWPGTSWSGSPARTGRSPVPMTPQPEYVGGW